MMRNKLTTSLVASLLLSFGCAESKSNLESSSVYAQSSASKSPASYQVFFTTATPGVSADMEIKYKGRVIKSSHCAMDIVGAPSEGGPETGYIRCDVNNGGVTANLNLTNIGGEIYWNGMIEFFHGTKIAGEFSCTKSDDSRNALDCFYKPTAEPPVNG